MLFYDMDRPVWYVKELESELTELCSYVYLRKLLEIRGSLISWSSESSKTALPQIETIRPLLISKKIKHNRVLLFGTESPYYSPLFQLSPQSMLTTEYAVCRWKRRVSQNHI